MKEDWEMNLKRMIEDGDDIFFENFTVLDFIRENKLEGVTSIEVLKVFNRLVDSRRDRQ